MNNPDDLDSMTDDQLRETFAMEVAEMTVMRRGRLQELYDPDTLVPPFATSADAVLPWLEKLGYFECERTERSWKIFLNDSRSNRVESPTFARMACIALIRAKRAEK